MFRHKGCEHIVRRMLAEVGHPVNRLIRVAVRPVRLGELRSGRWRHLTRAAPGPRWPPCSPLFALVDPHP